MFNITHQQNKVNIIVFVTVNTIFFKVDKIKAIWFQLKQKENSREKNTIKVESLPSSFFQVTKETYKLFSQSLILT